jgi:hypothetical protein
MLQGGHAMQSKQPCNNVLLTKVLGRGANEDAGENSHTKRSVKDSPEEVSKDEGSLLD